MSIRALDLAAIARLRMQALGLAGRALPDSTPRGVVAHHLGMQAQQFAASRWAIGSRAPGLTDTEVLAAYDRGEIVRSWPMRGTVHATVAEDLPWMLDLMGGRALSGVARRREALGIDEPFVERARDVAIARLRGGQRCTRGELAQAFTEAGLDIGGQRLYHTVWYLAQTGTLVQGPVIDGDHALVLLDEWIPAPRRLSGDDALRELGLRYLRARGPVTVMDLVHWTRLPKRMCDRALAPDGGVVVEAGGPGGPYRVLAEHLDELDSQAVDVDRSVLALAAFDEHLLGYKVRDAVLDPAHANHVDPARNGVFRWTIVIGGRVVATWKRTPRARRTVVEISPFAAIGPADRARVPDAVAAWGAFADVQVETRWTA